MDEKTEDVPTAVVTSSVAAAAAAGGDRGPPPRCSVTNKFFSALLASVAAESRRDEDNAQNILEEHVSRVWDATVAATTNSNPLVWTSSSSVLVAEHRGAMTQPRSTTAASGGEYALRRICGQLPYPLSATGSGCRSAARRNIIFVGASPNPYTVGARRFADEGPAAVPDDDDDDGDAILTSALNAIQPDSPPTTSWRLPSADGFDEPLVSAATGRHGLQRPVRYRSATSAGDDVADDAAAMCSRPKRQSVDRQNAVVMMTSSSSSSPHKSFQDYDDDDCVSTSQRSEATVEPVTGLCP